MHLREGRDCEGAFHCIFGKIYRGRCTATTYLQHFSLQCTQPILKQCTAPQAPVSLHRYWQFTYVPKLSNVHSAECTPRYPNIAEVLKYSMIYISRNGLCGVWTVWSDFAITINGAVSSSSKEVGKAHLACGGFFSVSTALCTHRSNRA